MTTGAVAAGIGPSIGGALVDLSDWRLVFLINLPIGAVVWRMTSRRLVESRAPGRRAMPDLAGALLLAIGALLVSLDANEGNALVELVVRGADAVDLGVFSRDNGVFDFRGDGAELGEEPPKQTVGRQRARDVGNDDGHAIIRADQFTQRFRVDRRANRFAERDGFVGQARNEARRQRRDIVRWNFNLESVFAVLKMSEHKVEPLLLS